MSRMLPAETLRDEDFNVRPKSAPDAMVIVDKSVDRTGPGPLPYRADVVRQSSGSDDLDAGTEIAAARALRQVGQGVLRADSRTAFPFVS